MVFILNLVKKIIPPFRTKPLNFAFFLKASLYIFLQFRLTNILHNQNTEKEILWNAAKQIRAKVLSNFVVADCWKNYNGLEGVMEIQ